MDGTNRVERNWRTVISGMLVIALATMIVTNAPAWTDGPHATIYSQTAALKTVTDGSTLLRAQVSEPQPTPTPREEWSYATTGGVFSSPALADIDEDGQLEVLVGSQGGKLYCLSSLGRPIWNYLTASQGPSSPAVADIDADGQLEVLVGSAGGKLYCLSKTGGLEWSYYVYDAVTSSPAIADIDADGQMEVLFKSSRSNLYCLNSTGGMKWSFMTMQDDEFFSSSPAIADIDADGQLEVLVGLYFWFLCLSGIGGVEWLYNMHTVASPALADIDGDGKLEVIAGDNDICCLNGTGGLEWSYPARGAGSSPAIADIDGDGQQEVLAGSENHNICCLNRTGGLEWEYATGDSILSSPAIADIDGDGQLEVLVGSADGKLYCLSKTGGLEWSYTTGGAIYSSPSIADIDRDGQLEVLVGSEDGKVYCLSVYSAPFISRAYPWPSIGYQGDVQHTGCFIYSDGDGLADNYEKIAVTNPTATDTDGDTAWDSAEFVRSTNPFVDTVAPRTIVDLAVSSPNNTSVVVTWTAPGDNGAFGIATGYIMVYSAAGPITSSDWPSGYEYIQSWRPLAPGSLENHTVTDLAPDTQYWFAVRAYDRIPNCGGVSNSPRTETTDTIPPSMIADLTVIGIVGNNITLAWTAPGDNGAIGTATSYVIKYSISGPVTDGNWSSATTYAQSWLPRSGGSVEVHTVTGLALGTTYWFGIKSQDEVPNEGAISNSPCGTTYTAVETVIVTIVQNNTIIQNRTVLLPSEIGTMSLVALGVGGAGVLVAVIALGITVKRKI